MNTTSESDNLIINESDDHCNDLMGKKQNHLMKSHPQNITYQNKKYTHC